MRKAGLWGLLLVFFVSGSSGVSVPDIIPTTKPTEVPVLITTKHSTPTRSLPKSTAVVSSPDPGVTINNGTDPTSVSTYNVVVPVVCGLLIKTLIFFVLFVVTKRSFG
uniref:Triggering receptor expressed on myeloid cells 1 n=1 Tax=Rattus norvegicus TaxID=10116 RepID=A0A8I5ZYI0_RAT